MPPNLPLVLGVLVFSGILLRLNGWRFLLFLRPSRVSVEQEAPGDQMKVPESLLPSVASLKALGFLPLGSRAERTPLGPELVSYDFVNATERAFATLYASRFGRPRLYLVTPTEGGGMVITADYRRPSRQDGQRYLSGGLPNLPAERLLKMHQRRLEGFSPTQAFTPEVRLELARAWFAGPGRREIRLQNLNGLVSSVLSGLLFTLAALAAFAILMRH